MAQDNTVALLLAKLSSVKRNNPDEAQRAIDCITEKEHSEVLHQVGQQLEITGPAKPEGPSQMESYGEGSSDSYDDESSEYSDYDSSTVSSIPILLTNVSGFGDYSPRSGKKQFNNLVPKDVRLKSRNSSRLSRPQSSLTEDYKYPKRLLSDLPPR